MFKTWGSSIIIFITIFLETTILKNFRIAGAKPDIALIFLVFFANYEGSLKGQLLGFGSGFLEDLLSLSPLGFNTMIRTTIGYLYGFTKGKIFIDPILMPIILVGIASLLKIVFGVVLVAVFLDSHTLSLVVGARIWAELGFNVLLSPFLFGFLKMFRVFRIRQDRF